jgi:hypothetical protein
MVLVIIMVMKIKNSNNKTAAMNSMWFSDGQVVEVQLGLVEA